MNLSKKFLADFERCSPQHRGLIQLLSIIYAPLSKSALLTVARRSDIPSGGSYTTVRLAEDLEHLNRLSLIQVTREGVRCNTDLMHAATLSAVGEGIFSSLAQTVQAEIPMVSEWGSSYYRTSLHALRDVRIGFYRRKVQEVVEAMTRFERQFPYEVIRCHPFVSICSNPFDPSWFRSLPEPLMIAALRRIISSAASDLSPSDRPFQILSELAAKPDLLEHLHDLYCRELMLRGRISDAEEAAPQRSGSAQRAILGWAALQRGDSGSAIEHFETSLAQLRKETGKRKTFFDDLCGAMFIVALMASRSPVSLDRAADHCALIVGKKDWPYQEIYRILEHVVRERKGEPGMARYLEALAYRVPQDPYQALFLAMGLHWCHSAKAATFARELPALAKRARDAGYRWVADELELAALGCGLENPGNTEVSERYRSLGLFPLCGSIERIEPWESALSALIRLKSDEVAEPAAKPEAQARLIWVVTETGRCMEIQPREQKVGAGGKWTSGRNVSLKRLAEETDGLDYLTDQDRRICGCIRQERDSGYSYYGSRIVHRLDQDKALPLMIGHPHLYADPGASVSLELLKGEPELQLVTEGETLQMRLYPPFHPDERIHLLKESPTRFKVFETGDEHRKIASIVGGGLKLPAKARDKALEAIGALSSILTVHSDIGSASPDVVQGDATPCFHLLPYNAGVKLELLVRPLSDAGPYFVPGAGGETVIARVEGVTVQAKRDLRAEVRQGLEAVSMVPMIPEGEDSEWEWLFPDPEGALELILQLRNLGDVARVAWPEGAKFKVRQEVSPRHCRLSIRKSRDWFEVEGEIRLNQDLALDLRQLVDLAKDGASRFVPLGDGDFLALSAQLRKHLDDLAALAEPHGNGLRFHPLAARIFERFAEEAGEVTADRQWQEQLQRLHEAEAFRPVLPATLQAELRGYQEEGFYWLNRLARWGVGACLADDMGLGKTVQALAQILSMADQGPSLVVAPTSVCLNWESETAKFAPTLNVIMFGSVRREQCLRELKPFDLVICSYGLLQQEAKLLAQVSWQAIVLDEAQAIKNVATKRSQAAMELNGAFRMVATGTPIENHLGELWNVFRFINPGLLGSLKQFNLKFAHPIEKGQDKKARGRLKKVIQPFILRRTKNQVLDELPPRTEVTVAVEMGEAEASFYEAIRRSALDSLAGVGKVEGKGELHLKILAEIMRLRRACCNPRLILPDTSIPSAKLAAFADIVTELRENRHKALVFSQFVGHLEIVRNYLDKAGISYQYLDGSTPPKERKRRMDDFQAGSGDLFLISLKAGGVGLNLTAADYVIHLDPWWNPAVEDQASDRAHRIGQQRPVTIYRLVAKGTIEEKIVSLHQHKRGLADSLLEESDLSGKISAEQLLALLRIE